MNKLVEHISVLNEYTPFGVLREEGTIIYDRTNKKMYTLTARGYSKDCLNSFSSKKEVYSVTVTVTVADNTTVYGFVSTGSGAVSPTSFYGVGIKKLGGDEEVTGLSLEFTGSVKINSQDTLSIFVDGYHSGFVTANWFEDDDLYFVFDAALKTYMQGEIGNTVDITIRL